MSLNHPPPTHTHTHNSDHYRSKYITQLMTNIRVDYTSQLNVIIVLHFDVVTNYASTIDDSTHNN